MAEMTKVAGDEHGIVRVFGIDLPRDEASSFGAKDVGSALGVEISEPRFVDVVDIGALAGMGLPGYLIEGIGADPDAVEQDRGRLAAVKGHAAIVLSSAFGGRGATLEPQAPLKPIGAYPEAEGTPTRASVGHAAREAEPPTTERPARPVPVGSSNRTGVALVSLAMAALFVLIIVFIL